MLTTQTSLPSLPACPLALKSCCQGRGGGGVYLSPFSILGAATSSPGFWEGPAFEEGETPPRWHSLKLAKVK